VGYLDCEKDTVFSKDIFDIRISPVSYHFCLTQYYGTSRGYSGMISFDGDFVMFAYLLGAEVYVIIHPYRE
jgi:hypothetical protein